MSSVTEGLGTSLLDAMACARPIVATRGGRHSRDRRGRRDRPAGAAARSRARWPTRSSALLKDDGAAAADGRRRLRARAASGSPSSGWWPGPPPCTRAWPADATQRTLRVACGAVEPARVHHPEVAEREVVLHRIVRIERAQRRGDVARHPPARAGVARQPQAPADADHVRVERHDQLRRRHARPDAEIERVAPHHPAQEQIQPLAARCRPTGAERSNRRPAASAPRPYAAFRSSASARVEKLSSAAADVVGRRVVALEKNPSIDPARSIICRSIHSSATMSAPRVQRWTRPSNAARVARADRTGGRTRPAPAPSRPARARSTAARSRRGRTPAPPRRTRRPRDRRRDRSAGRSGSDRSPSRDS